MSYNKGGVNLKLKTLIGLSMSSLILIFLASIAVGSVCWTYTINSWLEFSGKSISIVWWQGALIGLVPIFGQFSLPAAVLTWILMLLI